MTRTSLNLPRLALLARLRVRNHLRAIVQTAVAAVAAWYVASLLGTEKQPTFAAIAAVISLGATFDERPKKGVQLVGGVVLGILVADLLAATIGHGLPQIGLLVLLAMLVAVTLGGSELLISEAAVSAMLVASLPPSTADIRLVEGLVGGGVALLVHAFVFPPNPVLSVARAANKVFDELGITLREAGTAILERDQLRADSALRSSRHADRELRQLGEAVQDLGRAVWEVPGQFEEPWRSGDVHVLALGAAAHATAAAEGHPDRLVRAIASHARSLAVDVTRISEAAEDADGVLAEAATEELLVNLPRGGAREPAVAG